MAGRPKTRAKAQAAEEMRRGIVPAVPAVPAVPVGLPSLGPEGKAPGPPAAPAPAPAHTTPAAPSANAALGLPVGSDEASLAVLDLTVAGVPAERVARYLGCTVEELIAHHQRQLDVAVDEATRLATVSLITKARLGDVAAMTTILKANEPRKWDRGKTTAIEVSGPGGKPIEVAVKHALIDRIMAAMPEPKDVSPTAMGKLKLPEKKMPD